MFTDAPPVRLMDQLRRQIRYLHYSIRTEQAYVHWVRGFIRFHDMRHPADLGAAEVQAFLSWLAADRQVSVSTHQQALSALLFLYQKVLGLGLRAYVGDVELTSHQAFWFAWSQFRAGTQLWERGR